MMVEMIECERRMECPISLVEEDDVDLQVTVSSARCRHHNDLPSELPSISLLESSLPHDGPGPAASSMFEEFL